MLKLMQPGTVLVDVAIDQGGCFETSRPTTHSDPVYVLDGIVHYAVANIPGAVSRTSTFALTNATQPYTLALADKGWKQACKDDPGTLPGCGADCGRDEQHGDGHHRNCGHGRRTGFRDRRPCRLPGYRSPDKRRLRRFLPRTFRFAFDAEFLRERRVGRQHRQRLRCGLSREHDQPYR